jgi:pilus assembly protein CpaB
MGATRMMIVLVVAAVSAILLAVIVHGIVGHRGSPPPVVAAAAPAKPMTQVLVAQHDLPIGTRLAQGDLTWQPWPADGVNAAFITDGQTETPQTGAVAILKKGEAAATQAVAGGPMEATYGSIVRTPILASEPITQAKLVRGGQGGYMAVVLGPGMRALSVPVNTATAAGGFILPGDRVDVMQSHPNDTTSGGRAGFTAETLLRNVRVLAIDQASDAPKNGVQSMVGAVATLEVAAADAPVLARGKAQGELVLALRSYSDAGGPTGRNIADDQNTGEVRIFRNGQVSSVVVAQ